MSQRCHKLPFESDTGPPNVLDDGRSILERKTACDVEITPDDLNVYVLR
jgi:hypothetical protein